MRWLSPEWEYVQRSERSLAPAPVVHSRFVVLESGQTLQRLLARHLGEDEILPVTSLADAGRELRKAPAEALLVNSALVGEALQRLSAPGMLPQGTLAIVCSVPGAADAAGTLGAEDYLVKPVSREALLAALERLARPASTVLIVDDEPDAIQLFRRTLRSAGRDYRVLTANDGQRALEVLREQHPDVMLIDLMMPEMTGFELLRIKGEDPLLSKIPTIVISARDPAGYPIVTNVVAAMREGGLSVPELLATIKALSRLLAPGRSDGPAGRATVAG